jgi:hypothetical protein
VRRVRLIERLIVKVVGYNPHRRRSRNWPMLVEDLIHGNVTGSVHIGPQGRDDGRCTFSGSSRRITKETMVSLKLRVSRRRGSRSGDYEW